MRGKGNHINKVITGIIVTSFLLIGNIKTSAQDDYNPYVKGFTATAIDGQVYLSWTTKAGFTCTDIHIEVSSDSILGFERRGTYFGTCGDATEKNYSYVLDNPNLNSLNFLKLELGTYGYSNTISVLVIKANEAVLILPHPVTSSSIMYFNNALNEKIEVKFHSLQGELIHQFETIDDRINFAEVTLPKGILIYTIIGDGILNYRGKLMVKSTY